MPTNPLKTDHDPSKPYAIRGSALNRQNNSTNAINAGHVIQRGASGFNNGVVKVDIPTVPFIFGIAKITDDGEDCPQDETEQDGYGFPCKNRNKYICEFRYYDEETGTWLLFGESLELDASPYYEADDTEASQPSTGPGYGPIPVYSIGDVTPAYLDVQRNKIIPVQSPPSDIPTGTFYNSDSETVQPPLSTDSTQAVQFYIEQFRAGVDSGFRVIGTISFPVSYNQNGTGYVSSSTFNVAPCPHGTLFRVRSVRGGDQDPTVEIKSHWQRLRLTGLGRRHPSVTANGVTETSMTGGGFTPVWHLDESTNHRFKDAPSFNRIAQQTGQPGLVQVMYHDIKDQWMIGVELYVAIKVTSNSTSTPIRRFKLTGTLSTGGSAAAVLRNFNGAAYADGDAIVVFDWYSLTAQAPGAGRGMWQGIAGMEGWCVKREVPSVENEEQYEIVWMEQYARIIQFTLTEPMGYVTAGQAAALVDASFFQGDTPGVAVTVHDDQGLFLRALLGAKGYAVRSEYEGTQPYYKVIECDQMVQRGTAVLTSSMCGGDPAFNTFVGTTWSTFSQQPAVLPTTGKNPRRHAAASGDMIALEWNEATGFWEVYDVPVVAVTIPTSFTCDDGTLAYFYTVIYAERCNHQTYTQSPIADCIDVQCVEACSSSSSSSMSGVSSSSSSSQSGVSSSSSSSSGGMCCSDLPTTLTVTLTALSACAFGCFTSPASFTITRIGSTAGYYGSATVGTCGSCSLSLGCNESTGVWSGTLIMGSAAPIAVSGALDACDPFSFTYNFCETGWTACRSPAPPAPATEVCFTLEVTE